jgi:hypothetical protein
MDPRVKALSTAEECAAFAENARRLGRDDLADEARRRAVQIRAAEHNATTAAEREVLQAIYAYEEVLTAKNGRRTRANRTWQMIHRHGILAAAERAVLRSKETAGYTALAEMGLREFAFEAVILRYPEAFSMEAVAKSKERLAEWESD